MAAGDRSRWRAVAALVVTAVVGVPATGVAAGREPIATEASSPTQGVDQPLPTADEVARAAADAVAAARLAESIRAEEDRATARLVALQAEVTTAVRDVRAAEADARRAAAEVDAARQRVAGAAAALVAAERARNDQAAVAYQQGGSLGLLPILIDPRELHALPDLTVVLEGEAQQREATVDADRRARDAAVDAQRELGLAQAARDRVAARATLARTAAEASVAQANAEVARVGARLAEAQQRLDELVAAAAGLGAHRASSLTADIRARAEAAGHGDLVDTGTTTFGSDPGVLRAQLDPRAAARELVGEHGWSQQEMACLDALWQRESGWSWSATNATSGAYGIPQALPGWKMATAGPGWLLDPRTQITWGLDYIEAVYGSPCGAWSRWQTRSPHWY
jgi:hypothetical protein